MSCIQTKANNVHLLKIFKSLMDKGMKHKKAAKKKPAILGEEYTG